MANTPLPSNEAPTGRVTSPPVPHIGLLPSGRISPAILGSPGPHDQLQRRPSKALLVGARRPSQQNLMSLAKAGGTVGTPHTAGGAEEKHLSGEEMDKKIVEYSPQRRYVRFNEILGKGAYKMVYRAYDTKEGLLVAWNTISLSGLPKHEKVRIMHEVRLLEQLDHGNIISFFGSWVNRDKEEVVFITEILSSGSLKDFIKKVQVIRWKIIKRWCKQILRGLSYLHGHEPPIIHRDLKCDNIFINGSSGDLRIGDLGLSTYINSQTKPLSVLGTPEFMAPELYDEKYDEKVDVYAFGMCVLEMISKETPYCECTNAAQIFKKVTGMVPPQVLYRVRNEKAREFIALCIHQDPRSRPSVDDLLNHVFLRQHDEDDEEVIVDPRLDGCDSHTPGGGRPAGGHQNDLRLNGRGNNLSSSVGGTSITTPQSNVSTLTEPSMNSLSSSDLPGLHQHTLGPPYSATSPYLSSSASTPCVPNGHHAPPHDAPPKAAMGAGGKKPIVTQTSLGGSQSEYSTASEMDPNDLRDTHEPHTDLPLDPLSEDKPGVMSNNSSCHSLSVSVDSHHSAELNQSPDLCRSASDQTLDSTGSPVPEGHDGPSTAHPAPADPLPPTQPPLPLPKTGPQPGAPLSRAHSLQHMPTQQQDPMLGGSTRAAGSSVTFTRSGAAASGEGGSNSNANNGPPGGPGHSSSEAWALLHVSEHHPPREGLDQSQQGGPRRKTADAVATLASHKPGMQTPSPGSGSPAVPTTVEVREGQAKAADHCCIPLVIRTRMHGKITDIEFDFNLDTDDAQQVAQEMVQELGLPVSDVKDIVRYITDLADKVRLREAAAASLPPPPQQRPSPHLDLPPLPHKRQPPPSSGSPYPLVHTHPDTLDRSNPGHPPHPPHSRPRDTGSVDSHDGLMLSGPHPSSHLSQSHGHDHTDDEGSRASPPGSSLTHEEEGSKHPHGLSDDDSEAGDMAGDDEFAKLRAEYEKNKARSRKAFDIRLENLQKSKAEKEEIHRKLQDKYTKEMAEFEKKKAAAEKEQEQRLKELEEHWRMVRAEYKEKKRMARAALHHQHHPHAHLHLQQPNGPNSSAGHTPTSSASSSPLPPPHDKPAHAQSSLHPPSDGDSSGGPGSRSSRANSRATELPTPDFLPQETAPLLGDHMYFGNKDEGGSVGSLGDVHMSPQGTSTAPPHA